MRREASQDEDAAPVDLARAFDAVHRPSLETFALLFMLGDRVCAERAAESALRAGARQVDELRHPERAAAWLRRHVVRSAWLTPRRPTAEGAAQVRHLGVVEAGLAGLAALKGDERAALIADVVEGLDPRDVATIVDRDPRGVERLLAGASAKYRAARAAALMRQAATAVA